MWFTLALAILAYAIALYVPGFMLARAFSIDRFAAAVIAPALSIFVFTVLGVALFELDVASSGFGLLTMTAGICLIAMLGARCLRKVRGVDNRECLATVGDTKEACKTAALYLTVAFAIATLTFLLPIDGPESFSRNDDTTVHLSVVRSFLDTGTYSTLHVSSYLAQNPDSWYYPAGWHVVTAVVASLFDNNVALAANASVVTFVVIVFPLGMCLLLLKIFGQHKCTVLTGSLFTVAFCGFPWGFIVFGQLFSNMVSFMLIPLAFIPFAEAIEAKRASDKLKLAAISTAGLVAVALCQPNGAFTFGIWVVLYCVNRIFYAPGSEQPNLSRKRIAGAVALFTAACAAWAILYLAPFMQTVVQYTWEATLSPAVALASGLSFMFMSRGGVQPFLSVVVLAGIIYTCRSKRYLWLSVAYAFALLSYLVSVSTDGVFKHVIAGFWYTDYHRLGAMAAFFAIPLAALGFSWMLKTLKTWLGIVFKGSSADMNAGLSLGMLLILFAVCQFIPGNVKLTEKVDLAAGLTKIRSEVAARYSWDRILTGEEDAFIKEVMSQIPEDALVINVPSDGSCWSYGVEGINTYFRRSANTGMSGAEDSKIIRTQLCDIDTSDEVRSVVNRLDARYVLLLDEITSNDRTTTGMRYKKENWEGIESIDEKTPGFTLLMSEGNMRLYEIDR